MQASSSQAVAVPLELPKKEKKPRQILKKGKARQEDSTGGFEPNTLRDSSNILQREGPCVEDDLNTWAWASLSDTSVSKHPPVFTRDCRYFFSISGPSVKIHATATGQVVSTLSACNASSSQLAYGHTADITAAVINPQNSFQLLTASLDGMIKIWDFLDATLLSTIDVGEPITHMCMHESMHDHVFIATTSRTRQKKGASTKEQSNVFKVSLRPSKATAQKPVHRPVEILKVGKMRSTTGLAVSPSGLWLVGTGGPKAYVCSTSSLSSGFTKFVSNEMLTCLAFHPSEEYFATGDQKGQVRLWYCLDAAHFSAKERTEKRAQTTTLHWHAHGVSSIAFTANGSYLLSGGEEAVLVIWQLHTGKREFVPRVGAPIVGVAVANNESAEEEYLLTLADGTLTFIGAGTLRISRAFSKVKLDPNYRSFGPAPLAVHTQTSTIILPSSHPSSLLIYAPLTSNLLAELEVSPSNRVSRRDEKAIEPSRVVHVATSSSGEWLATIDGREGDDDFEREIYMKIWQWDVSASAWNLNSRIDRPHGVHQVNALTFSSGTDQSLLISAGNDRNIKVWRTKTVSNKNGEQEVFWLCRSTLGYRSHIPTEVVCSPDGSLLAVAHGPHAVVFELSNNVLRTALTCPEIREVSRVAFVGSSGRYVVVAGHQDIVLWDLVYSSVQWHHSASEKIDHLVPHPSHDSFAVMYHARHPRPTLVRIFGVASFIPLSSSALPFKLRQVIWYPYVAFGSDFSLVGISQSWGTVVVGDRIQLPESEGSLARSITMDTSSHQRNIFQDIFGASAFQDFTPPVPVPAPMSREDITTLASPSGPLSAPAYLLPPLHTLFTPLIKGLLREQSTQSQIEMGEEKEIEDKDVVMTDSPTIASQSGRALNPEELDKFIGFFKQPNFSTVTVLPRGNLTTPKPSHSNGIAKSANGTSLRRVTSSATHSSHFINGKSHPPECPMEQATQTQCSSPALIGKKRKKSMG